ncbi:hypothetical protein HYPSUDRAFT_57055 [Hypholoma sublateritium FD-334 SS-4]|uniref:Uncharacterized protein n=1 Tax=Hypholoma sublateritium (strain FD-334 SS-4) TaxID=945553 RepID=A0A0D2M5W9_HYPSF|nr:hypothetical protein HYPSUDRAFT_57055 [Hypholoma sublateritium FD-334 SS-4]
MSIYIMCYAVCPSQRRKATYNPSVHMNLNFWCLRSQYGAKTRKEISKLRLVAGGIPPAAAVGDLRALSALLQPEAGGPQLHGFRRVLLCFVRRNFTSDEEPPELSKATALCHFRKHTIKIFSECLPWPRHDKHTLSKGDVIKSICAWTVDERLWMILKSTVMEYTNSRRHAVVSPRKKTVPARPESPAGESGQLRHRQCAANDRAGSSGPEFQVQGLAALQIPVAAVLPDDGRVGYGRIRQAFFDRRLRVHTLSKSDEALASQGPQHPNFPIDHCCARTYLRPTPLRRRQPKMAPPPTPRSPDEAPARPLAAPRPRSQGRIANGPVCRRRRAQRRREPRRHVATAARRGGGAADRLRRARRVRLACARLLETRRGGGGGRRLAAVPTQAGPLQGAVAPANQARGPPQTRRSPEGGSAFRRPSHILVAGLAHPRILLFAALRRDTPRHAALASTWLGIREAVAHGSVKPREACMQAWRQTARNIASGKRAPEALRCRDKLIARREGSALPSIDVCPPALHDACRRAPRRAPRTSRPRCASIEDVYAKPCSNSAWDPARRVRRRWRAGSKEWTPDKQHGGCHMPPRCCDLRRDAAAAAHARRGSAPRRALRLRILQTVSQIRRHTEPGGACAPAPKGRSVQHAQAHTTRSSPRPSPRSQPAASAKKIPRFRAASPDTRSQIPTAGVCARRRPSSTDLHLRYRPRARVVKLQSAAAQDEN